jgi:hypothetical protein
MTGFLDTWTHPGCLWVAAKLVGIRGFQYRILWAVKVVAEPWGTVTCAQDGRTSFVYDTAATAQNT